MLLLLLLVVALYSVVHVSLGHKSIIIKRNKNTVCRPLKNALKYRYRFSMIFCVQIVYRNSVKHEPRNMPSKFGGYSKTSRSKQTVCQLFPISMGTRSLAIRDDDAKHVLDELVCGPPCTFPCYSVVCLHLDLCWSAFVVLFRFVVYSPFTHVLLCSARCLILLYNWFTE